MKTFSTWERVLHQCIKLEKMLREASIGWSRERYLHRLERVISQFENLEELDDINQRRLNEYRALYQLIDEIFYKVRLPK